MISVKNSIPEEFPKILHDLIQEIIKNKPQDILDFAIKYFYCLENNIPLSSIKEIKTDNQEDKNKVKKTTIATTIEETEMNNDNIKDKDNINKEVFENESRQITLNDNNEEGNDNNEEGYNNNKLDDSEEVVPLTKEMVDYIEKKNKEDRPLSALSGVSETYKKGIKDFVSDLFMESEKDISKQ